MRIFWNGRMKVWKKSITQKILVLVIGSITASFLVSMLVMKRIEIAYSNYIYENKTELLNSSISGIEDRLLAYENYSYQFVTSDRVQQYVSGLLESYDEMEQIQTQWEAEKNEDAWNRALQEKGHVEQLKTDSLVGILKELDTVLSGSYQVDAGYFVDQTGKLYNAYNGSRYELPEKELQAVLEDAALRDGSPSCYVADVIQKDGVSRKEIVLSRSVREKRNLSMRNCGTVIYLVNPEKLVSSFLTENNNMLIVDRDGAVIFSSLDTAQQEELIRHIPSLDNRYEIRKLENQTYFITSRSVSRLGWNYYNVADYDQLFSFIHKMDLLYSFVLLGILVVIGLLTAYISVGLLKPIVILSKRIEAIGNDEDPVRALNGQKPEKVTKREDEIGQLETAFSDMAQRLSDLIRENYEQKLYLQNAKLSALRSKLNPHFLYNTLDTIRWMATEEKYHKIPGIVKALGDILRISINSKENLIPVDQEMQYMRGYLMIQKARFGERLNVCMEVSEELLSARIPAFSIQPLLENAVNYALEKMEKPCRIQVSIRQENSDILCSVADNGDGMDPQILDKLKLGTVKAEGNGMGLTNLNERLKSLYGPEYGVQVEHSDMGGALISFRVKKEVEYKDGVTESNAGR